MSSVDQILIFGSDHDLHTFAIKKTMEEKYIRDVHIVDLSKYPMNRAASATSFAAFCWRGESPRLKLSDPAVVIGESTAIWWRRPQAFSIPPEVTDDTFQKFIEEEWKFTFDGAVAATNCHVVNDFHNQRLANNKIYQLQKAKDVGFNVPRSIISNSIDEIRSFECSIRGPVIFKPQGHSKYHVADTRVVDDEFYKRGRQLGFAPVIVQAHIDLGFDIRANVVRNECFFTKIFTNEHSDLVDWRLALNIRTKRIEFDDQTSARCIELVKRMGLLTGAIDLRVNSHGDVYFFEINPSGQFLFCEEDENLDITSAYCRALIER